jgi:hypothetical protein
VAGVGVRSLSRRSIRWPCSSVSGPSAPKTPTPGSTVPSARRPGGGGGRYGIVARVWCAVGPVIRDELD